MIRTLKMLCLLAAMAGALCLTPRTPAAAGRGPVTTSLWIPFPSGPSLGENIAFSGSIHVVIQALPQEPFLPQEPTRVYTNLAGVTGVGVTSGMRYLATGAAEFTLAAATHLDFTATYRLIPVEPFIPQEPMRVRFFLSMLPNGQVGTAASEIAPF